MAGVVHEIDDEKLVEKIRQDATAVAKEMLNCAKIGSGDIVVVGCSTSETLGEKIGSYSVPVVGKAIYEGISSVFLPEGIYIAGQCCEHLNRAIVIERKAVKFEEIVNVVPRPKAGGSFATACYELMENPVVVEEIKADAGIDIGGTLIGMHLKKVAVPMKLINRQVGHAFVSAARVRPKYIGGSRAQYDDRLG